MHFILPNEIAAWAATVVPELPMSHHNTVAKKTADVLGHPKTIQRWKKVGSHFHSIPINIPKGGARDTLLTHQEGAQLGTKNCPADSLGRV